MTPPYDLFWSFRSPYSYLILKRLVALERDYDVRANVRPVYPLAVRTPEFFENRDPLWFSHLMADIRREAEFLSAAGHYGVPMIAFGGEAFFGQDRFEQFKWRLQQHGVEARGSTT